MNVWLSRGIFSINSFVAAMAALYIALSVGLVNPYWSLTTVYIVSQPQAGSVRSKALYRLLGTITGGGMAVLLVPALIDSPELLSLALALWVGVCLAVALLDRTPRSYVFMLSGYTAALIGFPSVTAPAGIFDVAVARVEEIALGITCATVMHSIFNPQGIGATLTARIHTFMEDAREWTLDALEGRLDPAARHAHKLAADVTDLYILATHLPFDTSDFQAKRREVAKLSERMALLFPLAATVGDRLSAIRQQPDALSPASEQLIADVSDWVAAGLEAPIEAAQPLIERARAFEPQVGGNPSFTEITSASLHARLSEMIEVYRDCRVLSRHISFGRDIPKEAHALLATDTRRALHRDYGMAAWSGLAAAIAILVVCTYWIVTGWADGGTAAMMTAIIICLFAALDDPAKAIGSFTKYTALSIPIAAIYLFAILPPLDSFAMLMLALAPFLLGCGIMMAIPAWTGAALATVMGAGGALAIQESFAPDFARFANSSLAMVAGALAAAIITRLIRSVGADFSAHRIIRLSWRDIARNTTTRNPPSNEVWIGRMVDRVGLLGPRLAALGSGNNPVTDTLAELRTGLNILSLRQLDDRDQSIGTLLADLRAYFLKQARGTRGDPPQDLMAQIDEAIARTSQTAPSPVRRNGLLALIGLRRSLFPQSTKLTELPA